MKKSSFVSRIAAGAAILAATVGLAFASSGAAKISADEALQKLLDGNKHYVENKLGTCAATDTSARQKLATTQHPYAIILSCSDSRVPPELIFDKSLGEVFVVRVAGNVTDPVILGSVEYAAEHLGTPLVMVLGHERCGAVTAAVDNFGKPVPGNIGAIVKEIQPAVKKAKAVYKGSEKGELVEQAVKANTRLVAHNLTKRSKVLAELVKEGKLKVVAAEYDLDNGKVELLK